MGSNRTAIASGRLGFAPLLVLAFSSALFPQGARGADPADFIQPPVALLARFLVDRTLPASIETSLQLARTKLGRPECAAVFTDFADAAGRPLAERLTAAGTSGADYLSTLYFANGRNLAACRVPTRAAFMEIGSRVVYICDARFVGSTRNDPSRAAHMLIHEALHGLGLGENPPSSEWITRTVASRCEN